MTKTELTGIIRFKVLRRFLRKDLLALQVQYVVKGFEQDAYGLIRDIDYTGWRDATVEDFTVLEGVIK